MAETELGLNTATWAGWTPLHVRPSETGGVVDWARLGMVRFTEPFFEQTVARALRDPARLLFRRETPVSILEEEIDAGPGLPPTGFIFHQSRCGSTLLAQMLAALPSCVVVAEPPALDHLLTVCRSDPRITRAQTVARVRGLINALGQPRSGDERHYFVKFDCWHTLELPLIRAAFPTVPWCFLYRDPVEVLVSHRRQRGLQTSPGLLDPRRFGIEPAELSLMSADAYGARVLAQVCAAALRQAGSDSGSGCWVNFEELPAAAWNRLSARFGVNWSADDVACMQEVARFDAKTPYFEFADDRVAKQREADPVLRELARTWLGDLYEQLESARRSSASN